MHMGRLLSTLVSGSAAMETVSCVDAFFCVVCCRRARDFRTFGLGGSISSFSCANFGLILAMHVVTVDGGSGFSTSCSFAVVFSLCGGPRKKVSISCSMRSFT